MIFATGGGEARPYSDASHAAAPWHVVPADHKPFAHMIVAGVMADALERLDPTPPEITDATGAELAKVRKALLAEAPRGKRSKGRP